MVTRVDHTPKWDARWAGTFQRELQALRDCGRPFQIDDNLLTNGKLAIDIDWLVGGEVYELRILYPDTYPRSKPEVCIKDPTRRPARHCNPVDGTVCLLGRDSRQWDQSWTAVDLLEHQFSHVVNGGGEEDPQGEPDEVFWNGYAQADTYCLVDSSWNLGDAMEGTAKIVFSFAKLASGSALKMAIVAIRNAAGIEIASYSGVVPRGLTRHGVIPWVRVAGSLPPCGGKEPELMKVVQRPAANIGTHLDLGNEKGARVVAVAFDSELSAGEQGIGWVVPFSFRKPSFTARTAKRDVEFLFARVLRAGRSDLLSRSSSSRMLDGKSVSVFGVGSIGAPAALELARAGCSKLSIFDYDVVEPGNSVRWPIGISAWGKLKTQALKEYLLREYPLVVVESHQLQIGHPAYNHDEVEAVIGRSDLVCDFTASQTATFWLGDVARERGVPLLSAFATQTVEGGVVASAAPDSSCPACLVRAWDTGVLAAPVGPIDADDGLFQPTGCAERTFTGSGHDLQEISLQAVRVAIGRLQEPARPSEVFTLCLAGEGIDVLPSWRREVVPADPTCDCRRNRK